MFRDHDNPVARPLQFGARTAQRLMAIACNRVLADAANATHASFLPTSWSTLYELARLPEPVLEKALEAGLIGPTMERKHVPGLPGRVVALDGPRLISTEASTPAARDFNRLRDEILSRREFADRWQALQELEREEEALAKKLAHVREQVRQGRQRLAEDLQQTVEAEHGPIRYRSELLAGKGRGRRATHGAAEMLTVAQTLPFNGAVAVVIAPRPHPPTTGVVRYPVPIGTGSLRDVDGEVIGCTGGEACNGWHCDSCHRELRYHELLEPCPSCGWDLGAPAPTTPLAAAPEAGA